MQFDSIARKTYTNQISACFVLCLIYSHFLLRYDYLISRTQPYARSIFFSFNVSNCNVFVLFLFICHCYFRSNLVLSTAFSIIIILFNNLFICCCCCFCRVFFFFVHISPAISDTCSFKRILWILIAKSRVMFSTKYVNDCMPRTLYMHFQTWQKCERVCAAFVKWQIKCLLTIFTMQTPRCRYIYFPLNDDFLVFVF